MRIFVVFIIFSWRNTNRIDNPFNTNHTIDGLKKLDGDRKKMMRTSTRVVIIAYVVPCFLFSLCFFAVSMLWYGLTIYQIVSFRNILFQRFKQ